MSKTGGHNRIDCAVGKDSNLGYIKYRTALKLWSSPKIYITDGGSKGVGIKQGKRDEDFN